MTTTSMSAVMLLLCSGLSGWAYRMPDSGMYPMWRAPCLAPGQCTTVLTTTTDAQAVRKLHGHLKAVQEAAVDRTLPEVKPVTLTPQVQTLDEDLDDAAQVTHANLIGVPKQLSQWTQQWVLVMMHALAAAYNPVSAA